MCHSHWMKFARVLWKYIGAHFSVGVLITIKTSEPLSAQHLQKTNTQQLLTSVLVQLFFSWLSVASVDFAGSGRIDRAARANSARWCAQIPTFANDIGAWVWVFEQLTFERGSSSSTLRASDLAVSGHRWHLELAAGCPLALAVPHLGHASRQPEFGSRAAIKGSGSESQSFSHFPARLVVQCVSTRSGLTACFYVMCLGHSALDQSALVFFTSLVANGTTPKSGIGAARAFAGASRCSWRTLTATTREECKFRPAWDANRGRCPVDTS